MDIELNIKLSNNQMTHLESNQIMAVYIITCNYNKTNQYSKYLYACIEYYLLRGNDLRRDCKQIVFENIEQCLNWNGIVIWDKFIHLNDIETTTKISEIMKCIFEYDKVGYDKNNNENRMTEMSHNTKPIELIENGMLIYRD